MKDNSGRVGCAETGPSSLRSPEPASGLGPSGDDPARGCECVNVDPGSYANQEDVITPAGKVIGIDRCILPDVEALWRLGIRTIESCCGHQRSAGYIAVTSEQEPMMRGLGYRRDPRTTAPGCFLWPKDESPITVGKLEACREIALSRAEPARAMRAMAAVINARGWLYAEVLQRFRDRDAAEGRDANAARVPQDRQAWAEGIAQKEAP